MKALIFVLILGAGGYYYFFMRVNCETKEDVYDMAKELVSRIDEKKMDLSANKLLAMTEVIKNAELAMDPQKACEAMDDLISEL